MKRIMVAMESGEKMTEEMMDRIADLAKRQDAMILGVIEYPLGLMMKAPELFIDIAQSAAADIMVVASPEFFISEIVNDDNTLKILKEKNIDVYDIALDMRIEDAINEIPKGMLEMVNGMLNPQDEIPKNSYSKSNLFVITEDTTSEKYLDYMDQLEGDVDMICEAQMNGYLKEMEPEIRNCISEHGIGKIIVIDDMRSLEFDSLLESFKEEGREVIYANGQELSVEKSIQITEQILY